MPCGVGACSYAGHRVQSAELVNKRWSSYAICEAVSLQSGKCYVLVYTGVQGKQHLLVAGEKHAPCYLLDLEGNLIDTVWEEPGGVMTMVAIPDRDGMFLATHQFILPMTPSRQGWFVQSM